MQHLCCVSYQPLPLNATPLLRFICVALQSDQPSRLALGGAGVGKCGDVGFGSRSYCGCGHGSAGDTRRADGKFRSTYGAPFNAYLNPAFRTRKKGGLFGRPPFLNRSVGVETDRSYERLRRPVGSSCLRRSCGRSSSKPRRPQPSVFPRPPSPGSSAPADRCRGYSCPRPLSDPTD